MSTVSVCGETPSEDCANGRHQGHTHTGIHTAGTTRRRYILLYYSYNNMYDATRPTYTTDNEHRVHLARALPYRVVYTTPRRRLM